MKSTTIKNAAFCVLLVLIVLSLRSQLSASPIQDFEYAPDEIIITVNSSYFSYSDDFCNLSLKEQLKLDWIVELTKDVGPDVFMGYCASVKRVSKIGDNPFLVLKLKEGVSVDDAIEALQKCQAFRHVEKNVIFSTDISTFISRLFTIGLDRTPDFIEERLYGALLEEGSSACDIAKSVLFSTEFRNRNLTDYAYVQLLYRVLLNRFGTNAEIQNMVQFLSVGMSREFVFYQFINSSEFSNICNAIGVVRGSGNSDENRDQNFQVTSFVFRLYDNCLQRTPDVTGLNNWTGVLNNQTAGGKTVAHGFFFSQEFISRNTSDNVFVNLLYQTMLNRIPSDSEVNSWLNAINYNNATREDVFNGFGESQEFESLCASYGILAQIT